MGTTSEVGEMVKNKTLEKINGEEAAASTKKEDVAELSAIPSSFVIHVNL